MRSPLRSPDAMESGSSCVDTPPVENSTDTGAVIGNHTMFEAGVPPTLTTLTAAVPAAATSAAEILAINCARETNCVGRALPFHSTIAPGAKLAPWTVRLNAALPGEILTGTSG